METKKEEEVICAAPYEIIDGLCCLDLNDNKICDDVDVTTTTTTLITTTKRATTTITSTTTTTTTIKYSCYKNIDCGNSTYSENYCYRDVDIDKTYSSKNFIIPVCDDPGNETAACVYLSKKIDVWLCEEKCVNGTCVGKKVYML